MKKLKQKEIVRKKLGFKQIWNSDKWRFKSWIKNTMF